jgi:hypothetical protein
MGRIGENVEKIERGRRRGDAFDLVQDLLAFWGSVQSNQNASHHHSSCYLRVMLRRDFCYGLRRAGGGRG